MDLAPGTMVTPNVRLVELLGTGGMGTVWLADHLGLEARVAVKFLSRDLVAMEPSLRQRFKREASICARIRSVHVVQTFDHGTMEDGAPYIVMELLEGQTLTQLVESQGPMSPRFAAMMVAQIVKVIHRAHVLSIIHRDIKPDNIFITEDSDYELFVKVLDFGIAKQKRVGSEPVTATGAVVGTPEFMSPEQAISSKNVDYRSDLFSLGVVTFYALTGELPYDTRSDEPLWLQMSTGKMRRARDYLPDLPDAIDRWFECALDPKPENRFRSARTMADALATIVQPEDAHRIVDELSSTDGPSWLPKPPEEEAEDSHPAMYELVGPDSEEAPVDTVRMGEEDHLAAEDDAGLHAPPTDEPPTKRRPRVHFMPNSRGVLSAVAAGVYNSGVEGAFNQKVTPTLVDVGMATEPVDVRYSNAPRLSQMIAEPAELSSKNRLPAVLALVGAAALVALAIAWWHFA